MSILNITQTYTQYLKQPHNLTFYPPKCNNLFPVIQSSPSKTQIVRQNIREFGFQEQERRIICRQSELVRLECYYSLTLIFHLSTLSKYSKKNLKPGDQLSRQENANQ